MSRLVISYRFIVQYLDACYDCHIDDALMLMSDIGFLISFFIHGSLRKAFQVSLFFCLLWFLIYFVYCSSFFGFLHFTAFFAMISRTICAWLEVPNLGGQCCFKIPLERKFLLALACFKSLKEGNSICLQFVPKTSKKASPSQFPVISPQRRHVEKDPQSTTTFPVQGRS